MKIEIYLKRLARIIIYKLCGSDADYKKWMCRHYYLRKGKKRYEMASYVDIEKLLTVYLQKEDVEYIAERYCEHCFDYLGSGWVSVAYGAPVIGVEGNKYEAKQQSYQVYEEGLRKEFDIDSREIELLRDAIRRGYEPICWNRDYKSGYQWDISYLSEPAALQIPPGADIKTVWELGRMEFVMQLAMGALILPQKRKKYITEFKDVVTDFAGSNPVGVGVNWVLPMEASIRAINLLLAHDILCQVDKNEILDSTFEKIFEKIIYDHGQFIFDHAEISINGRNGNHYYSNIIGLIYVGAYLKKNRKAKSWYRIGAKEYNRETIQQFFEDGGNIEASTSYHRLMTELAVFGAAILLRKGWGIPSGISKRLQKAATITETITKLSGEVVQIGDNDSGRLVNAVFRGRRICNQEAEYEYENLKGYCKIYGMTGIYLDENILDHRSEVEYARGIFGDSGESFEGSFIGAIAGGKFLLRVSEEQRHFMIKKNEIPPMTVCKVQHFYYQGDSEIDWGYFPCFGIYYYKEGNMELYLYTGGKYGRIRQGHSHNDVMHCELCIGEKDILLDRGTYLYIENEKKNYMRGRLGHFVPDYGEEPRQIISTWGYEGQERAEVLYLDKGKIGMCYRTDTICHYRQIEIGNGVITITDSSEKEFIVKTDGCDWYSNGYGKLQRRRPRCVDC